MNDSEISIKVSLKTIIIIFAIIIVLLIAAIIYLFDQNLALKEEISDLEDELIEAQSGYYYEDPEDPEDPEYPEYEEYEEITVQDVHNFDPNCYNKTVISGKTYYERLNYVNWDCDYQDDTFVVSGAFIEDKTNFINYHKVVTYNEYLNIVSDINKVIEESRKDVAQYIEMDPENEYLYSPLETLFRDENSNYIVLAYANGHSNCTAFLEDCFIDENEIVVIADTNTYGVMASGSGYFIAIPTDLPTSTTVNITPAYDKSEIESIKKYGSPEYPSKRYQYYVDKPIIYLYPEEETNVSVKVAYPENLTCSYPKYQDGWNVLAKPNGDLIDLDTGKNLYSLYYEADNNMGSSIKAEGFCIKGEDSAKFLEEKLAILGLTEREAEEFIVYWLPKLEANNYNYIRFASMEEINRNMPLEFSVEPDTLIRVMMEFKGLDEPISVTEQQLETPVRTGFVIVEWGGTEIK